MSYNISESTKTKMCDADQNLESAMTIPQSKKDAHFVS